MKVKDQRLDAMLQPSPQLVWTVLNAQVALPRWFRLFVSLIYSLGVLSCHRLLKVLSLHFVSLVLCLPIFTYLRTLSANIIVCYERRRNPYFGNCIRNRRSFRNYEIGTSTPEHEQCYNILFDLLIWKLVTHTKHLVYILLYSLVFYRHNNYSIHFFLPNIC